MIRSDGMHDDSRALLLPAKPASALDESLPLVQALVGIALELHSSPLESASKAAPGSLEEEVFLNKERQRLQSLYKLFPSMLEIVSVDGFRPDKVMDMALIVEMAVTRFTQDMNHCIEQLTDPSTGTGSDTDTSTDTNGSPNDPFVLCNPRGFHCEAWQFLTLLSRLLLFDTVEVIAPAATSHLPTALILFIGKLQARIAQRKTGIVNGHTLSHNKPKVSAINTANITLHPYSTAPTSFEQLNSQVFGMLYIMCKHESALYDVMYGGHLRTLFSVFTNSRVVEEAFHDDWSEFVKTGSAPVWDSRGSVLAATTYDCLQFASNSSYRAGVMMVMTGILKEHPQDGLDYMQLHDLLAQLLSTMKSPHPMPKPAKSLEPDPAIEMCVDCVRLCMLILRTAIKHAPTHSHHPPGLTQPFQHLVTQPQSQGTLLSSPLSSPTSSGPLASPSRPIHLSASSNAVSASLAIPPDLFAPVPESECPLLEEFELADGYATLRDFVINVIGEFEVTSNGAVACSIEAVEVDSRGRRKRSYIQRKASKQSMIDDFLQQMRELVFIGTRPLKPSADQFASAQQPLTMARPTVRNQVRASLRKSRSGSLRSLHSQSPSLSLPPSSTLAPSSSHGHTQSHTNIFSHSHSSRGEKLESKNYYDVSMLYDSIQSMAQFQSAHIPTLGVPATGTGPTQAAVIHHRPFTVNTSHSPSLTHIANLSAFDCLLSLSRQSPSSYVRCLSLLHIHSILAAHPYNFLVLRDQHQCDIFAHLLSAINDDSVDANWKLLACHTVGFLVSFEFYVPHAELVALVNAFSREPSTMRTKPTSTESNGNGTGEGQPLSNLAQPLILSPVSDSCVSAIGSILFRLLASDRHYHQVVLHDLGLLSIAIDRIHQFERMLDIPERGTHKKLTLDQENEQRQNAGKTRLLAGECAVLDAAMDALYGLLQQNHDLQAHFKVMESGRHFALIIRLLMSDVTRRRAIRQMESLVELELRGGMPTFSTSSSALASMRRESLSAAQSNATSATASRDPSPPRSRYTSRHASMSSIAMHSDTSKQGGGGVHSYMTLCLDLIHELPVWHYEAKGLFLRSLRYLLTYSRRAQELFHRRSGLFNVFQLLEKIKVPELQRRKALRRRTDVTNNSKTAQEMAKLRSANSELEEMRAKEEAKLDALLLYVRDILQTLTCAVHGFPDARLTLTRFGYERIIDALYQTECFAHRHGMECVGLWMAWIAVEFRQGTEDGREESFDALTPLHSAKALDPYAVMLPVPAQCHVPLFAVPALALGTKCSAEFQLRVLTYFYVLARDDVSNRASLGQAGVLTALVDHYRTLILTHSEQMNEPSRRELRSTVLLLVRVLASFSAGSIELNALFAFLEEDKWEVAVDALIDIIDHGNQHGRLWPYVLFDLSRKDFQSHPPRGACVGVEQLRCSSGSQSWPPRDGYTLSAWIHIDQFSLEDEQRMMLPSPIAAHPSAHPLDVAVNPALIPSILADTASILSLFAAESEDGKSILRVFMHRRQLYLQTSRTALFHFASVTFEPRAWYHIGVSHTAGGVLAASKASLFVNGQLRQAIRAIYIESPTSQMAPVRALVGSPVETRSRRPLSPSVRAVEEGDDIDAFERIGDEDGDASEDEVDEAARLAEHDFSLPQSAAAAVSEPSDSALASLKQKQLRSLTPFSLSSMSSVMNFANLGGIQWRVSQCQLIEVPLSDPAMHAIYNANTPEADGAMELGLRKGKDNRRFAALAADCFHAESRLRLLLSNPAPASISTSTNDTAVLVSAPPRPSPLPPPHVNPQQLLLFYHASSLLLSADKRRAFLVNFGQDALHPQVSHGELRGSTQRYRPRGLPETLHKVGGMKRLLVLIARCVTSESLVKALTLLVVTLADSPRNHEELDEINGYRLLAFCLKHRVELIDTRVVDALLALVGLSDRGASGLIANLEALHALLLDFGLWRSATFTVKRRVFDALSTSVTVNPLSKANLDALRSAQLVKYMVSLLCDQHEVAFRLCLTTMTLKLFGIIVRDDLREHELRHLAEFIQMPSLSDEHNPPPVTLETDIEDLDPKQRSQSMDEYSSEILNDISDAYVKNRVLEMLLNAVLAIQSDYAQILAHHAGNKQAQLDKARERREKVQVFSKVLDLQWLYGVLKNASMVPASFTPSQAEQDEIDAITDPRLHTQTVLLALRLLSVMLATDSQLRQTATNTHFAVALAHLLSNARHCLEPKLYEILLALLVGKQVTPNRPIEIHASEPGTPEADETRESFCSNQVLSPSKLTRERSPWDYLIEGDEQPMLFFPEILPTVFALVTRALDLSMSKPLPIDHPTFTATLPSLASTIVSHVFIFLFKYFQKNADFRLLFAMTNTTFLTPVVQVIFTKMHVEQALCAKMDSRATSTTASPRGQHDIARLTAGTNSRSSVSVAASTRVLTDANDSDAEETFFSAFNASVASAALPPPGFFDRQYADDSDDEDSDMPTAFAPSASLYADALASIERRSSDGDMRRSHSQHTREIDEFEADARQFDVHTFTLAPRIEEGNERETSPHGPVISPIAPGPPSAEADALDDLPLVTVDFSDKCLALLFRFLIQIIFHALQFDRINPSQRKDWPPNLAVLQQLVLSPPNTVDAMTGLALPASGAPPAVPGNVEGWSIVEDIIDLVPNDAPPATKHDFLTRLLRYLSSRVHSRVSVWSAELLSNAKLSNNFLRLCQLWTQRMAGGMFQQGAFAVCTVCIEMLEAPTFQGTALKHSMFASKDAKTKSRIVAQLLASLHRALLLGYSDAAARRAVTEIEWLNLLVISHPKHFIDPPAPDSKADIEAANANLACVLFQLFETMLFADDWVRAPNGKPNLPRTVGGYTVASEDEASELAGRARHGAMQILAALLRGGKSDAIWRLLLNTDEKPSALFASKHAKAVKAIFAAGFDAMLKENLGGLVDWILEFDQDIKICLEATLALHWTNFSKQISSERKQANAVIEARIRAFVRLVSMEGQERARLLTRSEQESVRSMKSAYDSWVAAVLKRHELEENERSMQEQFEALLRELKKLEALLKEKEEKEIEKKKKESQMVMKPEGASAGQLPPANTSSSGVKEEEATSELERRRSRELALKWKIDANQFWGRQQLAKRRSRKRPNQSDAEQSAAAGEAAEDDVGAGPALGSSSRRRTNRGQVFGAVPTGPSLDFAALGADPALIATITANPMLASMLATISANPAMLATILNADVGGDSTGAGVGDGSQLTPAQINKFLSVMAGKMQRPSTGLGNVATAVTAGAPAAGDNRANLLAAISAKRKSSDVLVSDNAPPPPPMDIDENTPPFALTSSPFGGMANEEGEGEEGFGHSKLPVFKSNAADIPAPPPIGDVPMAPPFGDGPPNAPPMAPPFGDIPVPPPLDDGSGIPPPPPLDGIPAAPGFDGIPPPPPFAFGALPPPAPIFAKPAPAVKMKKLHWEAVDSAVTKDSIWSQLNVGAAVGGIDFGEFESKFSATAAKPAAAKPAEAAKPKFVSLLDPRRQQAIEIGLSRFGMDREAIVMAILAVDTGQLTAEHFKRLQQFAPTTDEAKALKAFKGDESKLGVAEKFHFALLTIPALTARLDACVAMLTLEERAQWCDAQLSVVESAMRGIKDSKYLQEVLTTVLAFGNYMNGNAGKQIAGFKLSALTRLGNTKSSDNKTSLLHYLVIHFEKSKPEVRDFVTDLAPTKEAHRIETSFVQTEVAAIRAQVTAIHAALRTVQSSTQAVIGDRFVEVLTPALTAAQSRLAAVDERLKADLARAEKLSKYFGELELKWEELFAIFHTFHGQFLAAEADVQRERELARQREKSKALQAKLKRKSSKGDAHAPSS